MSNKLRPILFVLLMAVLVSMAYGLNFMYFSDQEMTRFGDRIKFWHGDTLNGPIRSNSDFAIMQDPVFDDMVISTADDFWRGSPYHPVFRNSYPIVFNALFMGTPNHTARIRDLALEQGHFFTGSDSLQARVEVLADRLKIWWSNRGIPFDTATFGEHYLPDSAVVFFDCAELHLFGTISTKLIIGASGTILFEDNLVYASADAHGIAPAGHPEKLAVIAGQDLKIQNSWANGRENSHGRGTLQTDPDSSGIVLDGIFEALGGSFTFEQQNDLDSGYVCVPCGCIPAPGNGGGPDDRGSIYLFGSIMQSRRGYVHRSNCTSTGYHMTHRYDRDLMLWNFLGYPGDDFQLSDSSLDFGSVAVGNSALDTFEIRAYDVPIKLNSMRLSTPFLAIAPPDSYMWKHTIPLAFSPLTAGTFTDTLRFFNAYYQRWFAVPLRGTAIIPSGADDVGASAPARFDLEAYPNPFNPSTEIAFSLPAAGIARIEVYDILGQRVAQVLNGFLAEGNHRVLFDGQRLPSGLYFVRLETASHQKTLKLMLMR